MSVATGRGRSTASNTATNISPTNSSNNLHQMGGGGGNNGSARGGGSTNGSVNGTSGRSRTVKNRYSKADVRRITAMGFAEDVAVNALVMNNSDVEEAINSLVGGD